MEENMTDREHEKRFWRRMNRVFLILFVFCFFMMGYCFIRDYQNGYSPKPNFYWGLSQSIIISLNDGSEISFNERPGLKSWARYAISDDKDWFRPAVNYKVIEYSDNNSFLGKVVAIIPVNRVNTISK